MLRSLKAAATTSFSNYETASSEGMTSQPNAGFYRARTEKEQNFYDMDLRSSCQEKCYDPKSAIDLSGSMDLVISV